MMIKKIIITTTAFSVLLLTGCSQIAPDLDGAGKNNVSDATQIAGDTVTIDENRYGNENGTGGQYNSSSDGFQSIYFEIKIEGNCDEFGTDEYNYALGLKRAKAVKDGIAAQGVDTSKMVIVSFGESNPVCSNPTDGCYSQNRRVDLRLVK